MLGTLLAMAAVCGSCQPEEEDIGNTGVGEGLPATIRLEVRGEELVNIATRDINEVWSVIFIFWCITVREN